MKKMNIAEASEFFGVSKEAIHNRIRRGSLESVVENGIKFVIIDENNKQNTKTATTKTRTRRVNSSQADNRYYTLLEEQNKKLQERVDKLEDETKTLREQKEQMLIEERQKIEQIYKDKDEQLKNVLNAITTNFLPNVTTEEINTIEVNAKEELLEAEIEDASQEDNQEPKKEKPSKGLTSLKKYLKENNLSKKKIEKVLKRFRKKAKNDKRFILVGSKCYIDTSKYDYSDLL